MIMEEVVQELNDINIVVFCILVGVIILVFKSFGK